MLPLAGGSSGRQSWHQLLPVALAGFSPLPHRPAQHCVKVAIEHNTRLKEAIVCHHFLAAPAVMLTLNLDCMPNAPSESLHQRSGKRRVYSGKAVKCVVPSPVT